MKTNLLFAALLFSATAANASDRLVYRGGESESDPSHRGAAHPVIWLQSDLSAQSTAKNLAEQMMTLTTGEKNEENFRIVRDGVLTAYEGAQRADYRVSIDLMDVTDLYGMGPAQDPWGSLVIRNDTARSIARAIARVTGQDGDDVIFVVDTKPRIHCHTPVQEDVPASYLCDFVLN